MVWTQHREPLSFCPQGVPFDGHLSRSPVRTSRIFTDHPLQAGVKVTLDRAGSRYVGQVLRLRPGQRVVLFDGSGRDFEAELLDVIQGACRLQVLSELSVEAPPALRLHLGIGISRGERMDYAIQKSVELGVNEISPLFGSRSVVRLGHDRRDKRIAHWEGVIRSACEQSGRSRLPRLNPPSGLSDWLSGHPGGLMLYHKASATLASRPAPGPALNLLIGPEGGLSDAERAHAAEKGYNAVRLGPRVLRTETAPIAALAAIQVLWGDFR